MKPPHSVVERTRRARVVTATCDDHPTNNEARSAAVSVVFVGVVPSLRQFGKRSAARADMRPLGHARLRRALYVCVLGAVRRNDGLRPLSECLRIAGKPVKLALIAAMRNRLCTIYSVAKN